MFKNKIKAGTEFFWLSKKAFAQLPRTVRKQNEMIRFVGATHGL